MSTLKPREAAGTTMEVSAVPRGARAQRQRYRRRRWHGGARLGRASRRFGWKALRGGESAERLRQRLVSTRP
jgi:hypothetical protein